MAQIQQDIRIGVPYNDILLYDETKALSANQILCYLYDKTSRKKYKASVVAEENMPHYFRMKFSADITKTMLVGIVSLQIFQINATSQAIEAYLYIQDGFAIVSDCAVSNEDEE